MSIAQELKKTDPRIELEDRYEIAYEQAKKSLINSSPRIN